MKPRHVALVASVIAHLAGYYGWKIRPWMLQWGATQDEQTRPLPGDEIVSDPTHIATHAVTIKAGPEGIWPWLVQMGQNRARFSTHLWVEKLLLSGIPDVHEIHPEWQGLRVGDIMRTNREIQQGHPIGWPVEMVIPNRAVVVRSVSFPVGTYAYVLNSVDGEMTRLISRDRTIWHWWETPFRLLIFEPLHNYMQAGVLQGIRQRAEQATEVTMARRPERRENPPLHRGPELPAERQAPRDLPRKPGEDRLEKLKTVLRQSFRSAGIERSHGAGFSR